MWASVIFVALSLLLRPVSADGGPSDAKNASPPPIQRSDSLTEDTIRSTDSLKTESEPAATASSQTKQDSTAPEKDSTQKQSPQSQPDATQTDSDPNNPSKKKLGSALLSAVTDMVRGKEKPTVSDDGKPLDPKDPRQAAGIVAGEAFSMASEHAKKKAEKDKDNMENPIPDLKDASNEEVLKIFAELIAERKKLQWYMFLHIITSFVVGTLTYFLRSNPILLHVAVFVDEHNESWGANIEALWINHQEKMADFLLKLMEKKKIDPKSLANKKMKVEYKHKKFASVPVYRTYTDEPLPDDAKQINNNKLNLWKNWWNK